MTIRLTHLVRAHAPSYTEILFVSVVFGEEPGKPGEARARAASLGIALQVLGAGIRADGSMDKPDDIEVEVLAMMSGSDFGFLQFADSASVAVSHHTIEGLSFPAEWASDAVALGEAWAA